MKMTLTTKVSSQIWSPFSCCLHLHKFLSMPSTQLFFTMDSGNSDSSESLLAAFFSPIPAVSHMIWQRAATTKIHSYVGKYFSVLQPVGLGFGRSTYCMICVYVSTFVREYQHNIIVFTAVYFLPDLLPSRSSGSLDSLSAPRNE